MSAQPSIKRNETAWGFWDVRVEAKLRKWREQNVTPCPKWMRFCPVPHCAYLAFDVNGKYDYLGNTERLIYTWLQSRKDKETRNVRASIGEIAAAVKRPVAGADAKLVMQAIPYATVHDAVMRLVEKQLILRFDIWDARKHIASTWHIRTFAEALAALYADKNVGKTHANEAPRPPLVWHNNRANSRRLLTPEQVKAWHIEEIVPARPYNASVVSSQSSVVSSSAEPDQPAEPPAVEPAPVRMVSVPVSADQRRMIDELCGCIEGNRHQPIATDLAGEILAAAQATAAITGAVFPADRLGDFCGWIFDRNKTIDKKYDQQWIWKPAIHSPAAFMRAEAKKQELVGVFLDWLDRSQKKAERETWERCCAAIEAFRQYGPADATVVGWCETLSAEHAQVWARAIEADDRKHGGDGSGSVWPARPKTMTAGESPP